MSNRVRNRRRGRGGSLLHDYEPDEPKTLPRLDIKTGINHSPHVVILGAGASRACCLNGDRNGRKLPLMVDFVETLGIHKIIKACGVDSVGNFESVYSRIHREGHASVLDELNSITCAYFKSLELPEIPTLYDYLVLSLRPKDMIVTFNWDSLLIQAYKRWRHLGNHLPELVFLHGNVDLGVDYQKKVSGFLSDEPWEGRKLEPTRLLYPVEQKDYKSDPFIAEQWLRATDHLACAYYVTVYGYSAPTTDVEARTLLLNAWKENTTRQLAEIDIVDVGKSEDVEKSWSDFIVTTHGGASNTFEHNILMRHPRRSCEAFAFATLQQHPWHENPFPKANSLAELDEWVKQMIAEEETGKLADKAKRS